MKTMHERLFGKLALITGNSGGLGRERRVQDIDESRPINNHQIEVHVEMGADRGGGGSICLLLPIAQRESRC